MQPKFKNKTANRFVIVLTLLLLVQTLLLVRNYSQSWNGTDGGDGAYFSSIARNYVHYGIVELKGGQATNFGAVANKLDFNFYQHHPPMVPLLTYVNFVLFGESEGAARLAPILLTIGSGALLFALIRSFFGFSIALLSTFFFASFPMIIFFGRKPGYESPTLFFILLTSYFYFRFVKTSRKGDLIAFFIAMAAGLLTDWAVYFTVPIFMVHYWTTQQFGQFKKRILIGLPILAAATLGLFILNTYLAAPELVFSVFYQGMAYIGLIPPASELAKHYIEAQLDVSLWQYFRHILTKLDQLFSYPIILLALIGGFIILTKDGKQAGQRWIITLLLIVPILNWLLFWKSMYIHPWWGYYLAAPLAVLAAIATYEFITTGCSSSEKKCFINKTSTLIGVFIISITTAGSIPRIGKLHEEQIRLLPGEQFEQANFIEEVAKEITRISVPDSIILTNLPKSGTDRILPYYAKRNMVNDLGSVEQVDTFLREKQDKNKIYFLLYAQSLKDKNDPLIDYLNSSIEQTAFTIQKHQFILFNLTK